MVQVNGICRLLTQRFSSDLAGRVKYSTLCPSRRDSPSEARRAMPTRWGLSGRGNKGRDSMTYSPFVRYTVVRPEGFVKLRQTVLRRTFFEVGARHGQQRQSSGTPRKAAGGAGCMGSSLRSE